MVYSNGFFMSQYKTLFFLYKIAGTALQPRLNIALQSFYHHWKDLVNLHGKSESEFSCFLNLLSVMARTKPKDGFWTLKNRNLMSSKCMFWITNGIHHLRVDNKVIKTQFLARVYRFRASKMQNSLVNYHFIQKRVFQSVSLRHKKPLL